MPNTGATHEPKQEGAGPRLPPGAHQIATKTKKRVCPLATAPTRQDCPASHTRRVAGESWFGQGVRHHALKPPGRVKALSIRGATTIVQIKCLRKFRSAGSADSQAEKNAKLGRFHKRVVQKAACRGCIPKARRDFEFMVFSHRTDDEFSGLFGYIGPQRPVT